MIIFLTFHGKDSSEHKPKPLDNDDTKEFL